MVGEHTEWLPAVPVGEHCAGLKGVGETAAVKGNRATHLKLCGGSLGQPLVHRYTCTYTELVYSTTETITHALTLQHTPVFVYCPLYVVDHTVSNRPSYSPTHIVLQ